MIHLKSDQWPEEPPFRVWPRCGPCMWHPGVGLLFRSESRTQALPQLQTIIRALHTPSRRTDRHIYWGSSCLGLPAEMDDQPGKMPLTGSNTACKASAMGPNNTRSVLEWTLSDTATG